ncbi:MAG TPA: UDP-N-acetylmuramoyl-L-alanine--D-glutamate ligase [Terriglobia bacterium]|nr:UDP-N-acetylmuramoyl-L-alanine--D-glutamate ligase [Terriglobia bacterium]
MDVRGKRVMVVGFARSGRATADVLRRRGAQVTVTDSRPAAEFSADIAGLLAQKIGLELGIHREEAFVRQDLIVVSPGVPWSLPELEAARRRGIPVVPEVEAASWFLEGMLIGITGTNGKTTTTALLGKILEASGFPTFVGGNIGVPLISAVDQISPESLVVAELSSFQLEAIQDLHPHVAVMLNLTPNHLDRHASFADYASAKAQIFRNQTPDDYAVLNADDENVILLAPVLSSQKIFFSRRRNISDGVLVSNHEVIYRTGNLERVLFVTEDVALRGEFNLENALAATAAACVLGADFESIRNAVKEFRGVEHRLEYVRRIQGVAFYNDSKATSVDATAKALSAFDQPVHLILGGKDKGAPYAPLRPLIESRVRALYLVGAAAERIAEELAGSAKMVHSGDLETAVRQAFTAAFSGEVVLLSPACASYDQFHDFEERGRVFKDLVARLAVEVGTSRFDTARAKAPAAAKPASGASPAPAPPAGPANRAAAPAPGEDPQRDAAVPRPEARAPLGESISMYETRTEDVPSLDIDYLGHFADEQLLSARDLHPLEATEDELMPFEFTATPAARRPGQMTLGIPGTPSEPELTAASRRKGKRMKPETPEPAGG